MPKGSTRKEILCTRKTAIVASQEKLCWALLAKGYSPEKLAQMRLAKVPDSGAFEKYLERRAELGLDASQGALLLVDPGGQSVPREAVVEQLRFVRTVQVTIEGNAELCRGLLATRYGMPKEEEIRS